MNSLFPVGVVQTLHCLLIPGNITEKTVLCLSWVGVILVFSFLIQNPLEVKVVYDPYDRVDAV